MPTRLTQGSPFFSAWEHSRAVTEVVTARYGAHFPLPVTAQHWGGLRGCWAVISFPRATSLSQELTLDFLLGCSGTTASWLHPSASQSASQSARLLALGE